LARINLQERIRALEQSINDLDLQAEQSKPVPATTPKEHDTAPGMIANDQLESFYRQKIARTNR
jgi:hypothetical protein